MIVKWEVCNCGSQMLIYGLVPVHDNIFIGLLCNEKNRASSNQCIRLNLYILWDFPRLYPCNMLVLKCPFFYQMMGEKQWWLFLNSHAYKTKKVGRIILVPFEISHILEIQKPGNHRCAKMSGVRVGAIMGCSGKAPGTETNMDKEVEQQKD